MNKSKVNKSEAKKLLASGWTLAMVAEKYDVTKQRIQQIGAAEGWKLPTWIPAQCKWCGKKIHSKRSYVTWTPLCLKCRAKRKKEHNRRNANKKDTCQCGHPKLVTSSVCRKCAGSDRLDYALITRLHHSGYSLPDIARHFDAEPCAVYSYYRRHKIPYKGITPRTSNPVPIAQFVKNLPCSLDAE